jgi:hypothetical protein
MNTLEVVDDPKEIEKAQALFCKTLNRDFNKRVVIPKGHRGYTHDPKKGFYSCKYGLWFHYEFLTKRQYHCNSFGIGDFTQHPTVVAACEINFPPGGVNRRIAGAFARNSDGLLHVLHSGKIGGGRKGIGKSSFKTSYKGRWVSALRGGKEESFVLIGKMASPDFIKHLAEFVRAVRDFKQSVAG